MHAARLPSGLPAVTRSLTLIDRVEHELDAIMELVTRMRADELPAAALDVRGMQRAEDRGVTSAVWPLPIVQEDSESLSPARPGLSLQPRIAPSSLVSGLRSPSEDQDQQEAEDHDGEQAAHRYDSGLAR